MVGPISEENSPMKLWFGQNVMFESSVMSFGAGGENKGTYVCRIPKVKPPDSYTAFAYASGWMEF